MVEVYAGLDISDRSTHICLVDGTGRVVRHWSSVPADLDPAVGDGVTLTAADRALKLTHEGLVSAMAALRLAVRSINAPSP